MNEYTEKNDLEEEGLSILGVISDYHTPNKEDRKDNGSKKHLPWWLWVIIALAALAVAIFIVVFHLEKQFMMESSCAVEEIADECEAVLDDDWYSNTDVELPSCTMVSDAEVDGIHLQIFTPYNTVPTLHVGALDTSDVDIVFATCAADLGYDKGKIIGAFVVEGDPLSWGGGRKLGYCAIIDENIRLGVAESTPLFERAIDEGGSFFRQYPSVDYGEVVENNPKNAAFRRALCMLKGKVCIVATFDRVLMNDFSAALVKLGVDNAIFLMGGNAEGWYRTQDGAFHRLGEKYVKGNPNINYIVFRAE